MTLLGAIPRRCVNLPSGSFSALLACLFRGQIVKGENISPFYEEFGKWLGVEHVIGAATGRSAFQMALEALDLPKGSRIIFPVFTFPIMPMIAKMLGYEPVFCPVDPKTFNAGPEHFEPLITEKTGAVLATHLFGRLCQIREIVDQCRALNIPVLEDCAHACGLRVDGKQAGTFGDMGIFSFAEGKNMPCFGGGAVVTANSKIAERLRRIESEARTQESGKLFHEAISIWIKWLLTRPWIFSLTAYRVLRLKEIFGQPLMDSTVGNELLDKFAVSNPRLSRFANLQAAIGRLHLKIIDAFNQGAQRNAGILTSELGEVPGIEVPATSGDHIYAYYPLKVNPDKRDDLRGFLMRHGIDSKTTDMADCSKLKAFQDNPGPKESRRTDETALLEICVYPDISEPKIRRIARKIRSWAGLPEINAANRK
jgi:dTDP-4-amino-4,6-dideoxygalactose transaminase